MNGRPKVKANRNSVLIASRPIGIGRAKIRKAHLNISQRIDPPEGVRAPVSRFKVGRPGPLDDRRAIRESVFYHALLSVHRAVKSERINLCGGPRIRIMQANLLGIEMPPIWFRRLDWVKVLKKELAAIRLLQPF